MKKIILLVGVAFVLGMSSSDAGPAKCGEDRKIERNGPEFTEYYESYDCRNDALIASESARLENDALNSAVKRLEKFDAECAALPGTVTETVRKKSSETEFNVQHKGDGWGCEIRAEAVVKHHCGC